MFTDAYINDLQRQSDVFGDPPNDEEEDEQDDEMPIATNA